MVDPNKRFWESALKNSFMLDIWHCNFCILINKDSEFSDVLHALHYMINETSVKEVLFPYHILYWLQ